MKTPKQLTQFEDEDEEREFWSKNESTEFIDWDSAIRTRFPELKRTSRPAAAESIDHERLIQAGDGQPPPTTNE